MLIDWFTVGAQALNFVVLIWLMKRFLYGPVLAAIDAREQRIASQLADAAAKETAAATERDAFQEKTRVFDAQRATLLQKATDEAGAERRRLIDAAATAADADTARRQGALLAEAAALHRALGLRAQQEVFAIARETLADLASTSLEARVCEVFIGRLRDLDAPGRATLTEAIRTATEPVLVRSAFELPEAQRGELQQAVNETFSADLPLRFQTAPELVAGIELGVNGQTLEWSVAQHLASLENCLDVLLKKPAPAEAKPVEAPSKPVVEAAALPVVEAPATPVAATA